MIVFMQNNPCGNPTKGFYMGLKIFIHEIKCYFFLSKNIFPYFWDTEATFIIGPVFAINSNKVCIDKDPFITMITRIILFFFLIKIVNYLHTVNHEQPDITVYLRRR